MYRDKNYSTIEEQKQKYYDVGIVRKVFASFDITFRQTRSKICNILVMQHSMLRNKIDGLICVRYKTNSIMPEYLDKYIVICTFSVLKLAYTRMTSNRSQIDHFHMCREINPISYICRYSMMLKEVKDDE